MYCIASHPHIHAKTQSQLQELKLIQLKTRHRNSSCHIEDHASILKKKQKQWHNLPAKNQGTAKKVCEPKIGSSLQSAFARNTRSSQRGTETVGSIKSLLKKESPFFSYYRSGNLISPTCLIFLFFVF